MENQTNTHEALKAKSNQQLIEVLQRLPIKQQSEEIVMLVEYMRSDGHVDAKSSKQLLNFLDTIVEEIDRLRMSNAV